LFEPTSTLRQLPAKLRWFREHRRSVEAEATSLDGLPGRVLDEHAKRLSKDSLSMKLDVEHHLLRA
jgi:hypothetical protein